MKSIYIMKCNEFYKIGVGSICDHRLDSFRTGNPYQVDLVFECEIENAFEIESYIHEQFNHFRVRGEWFWLNNADLETIKSWILEQLMETL